MLQWASTGAKQRLPRDGVDKEAATQHRLKCFLWNEGHCLRLSLDAWIAKHAEAAAEAKPNGIYFDNSNLQHLAC